jgi:hypothetical protein
MTTVDSRPSFVGFYRNVFVQEHQHPLNVTFHVFGTLAGLALVAWCVFRGHLWFLLLFPMVHAAPGLLGHRLWERNETVGDLRVNRKDYSPLWFIAANHVLLLRIAWGAVNRLVRRKARVS